MYLDINCQFNHSSIVLNQIPMFVRETYWIFNVSLDELLTSPLTHFKIQARHWSFPMVRISHVTFEPRREKTGLRDFRPGLTETGLYSHRRWLETWNFGFGKQRDCTIQVAKTKALISFAVTAKLICVFVFAYAKIQFSHVAAQLWYWILSIFVWLMYMLTDAVPILLSIWKS